MVGLSGKELTVKAAKKLSERAKIYREGRLMGMSKRCAMIRAGYSFSTASQKAGKMDRIAFAEELEIVGATDKRIANVITEQMSAVKPVIEKGKITDWYPDNEARRKAAELAAIYKLTPRENGDKPDVVVNYYSNVPRAKIELMNENIVNRISSEILSDDKVCA